jgi:membrane-associated phospholipid phosphatase
VGTLVNCGAAWAADCALQHLLRSSSWQDNGVLHAIAAAANWWGGPGVIWFAALLWLGARAARYHQVSELGLRGAEGIAVSSAISGIIKGLAGRSRPFLVPGEPWHWSLAHGWTDARYFSMPSGHTTATFGFAVAASMAAAKLRPVPRVMFTTAVFASAVLVAFARTYLDQHWLSDVAAGAALGSVTGFCIARWHARHPQSRFDRALLGRRLDGR